MKKRSVSNISGLGSTRMQFRNRAGASFMSNCSTGRNVENAEGIKARKESGSNNTYIQSQSTLKSMQNLPNLSNSRILNAHSRVDSSMQLPTGGISNIFDMTATQSSQKLLESEVSNFHAAK